MKRSDQTVYPLEAVQRLVLHSQQLTTPNGDEPRANPETIADLVRQLVCVQIDTLQRVQRSHYLAIWSRLGDYDTTNLDNLVYADPDSPGGDNPRQLFEHWFHAACLLPLSEYRYRLQRMQSSRRGRGDRQRRWLAQKETQALLRDVYDRIKEEGASLARDFEDPGGGGGTWWNWKPAKLALEHLFSRGDLLIARRYNFQRVYDLAERVLPEWVDQDDPGVEETTRHILERTMLAAGTCAENQLADYCHDFTRTGVAQEITALIEKGVFMRISARLRDGDVHTLIVHRDRIDDLRRCAAGEISAERTTFLNPFDTLFYPGGRDVQFWGFRQVLEAYKPAGKRIWGYYCLPILHGSELIGRFDPRLDRKAKRLHLEALHLEPEIKLDDRRIHDVARAMHDFMRFHKAEELVVEQSSPLSFGKHLAAKLERI